MGKGRRYWVRAQEAWRGSDRVVLLTVAELAELLALAAVSRCPWSLFSVILFAYHITFLMLSRL